MSPILFLDFDDVICLNNPFGGYDALTALAEAARVGKPLSALDELWSKLFDAQVVSHLRLVHEEFSPRYVLSTSWRWFLTETYWRGRWSWAVLALSHKGCIRTGQRLKSHDGRIGLWKSAVGWSSIQKVLARGLYWMTDSPALDSRTGRENGVNSWFSARKVLAFRRTSFKALGVPLCCEA
jgi:hypothetical protein